MTGGYKFIETVNDDVEAWSIVNKIEDIIIEDDNSMRDHNGRIIWEEGYNGFEFPDYQYITFDLDKLQPDNYSSHGNMWTAIQKAEPWNIDEIAEIINENA